MSIHKTALTQLEEAGLRRYGLPIGEPSQLADAFRNGVAWVVSDAGIRVRQSAELETCRGELDDAHHMLDVLCEALGVDLEPRQNRFQRLVDTAQAAVRDSSGRPVAPVAAVSGGKTFRSLVWLQGEQLLPIGTLLFPGQPPATAAEQSVGAHNELNARRYARLQILGVAPGESPQLVAGTVLRFQSLDAYVDADLRAYPSRGEAKRSNADSGRVAELEAEVERLHALWLTSARNAEILQSKLDQADRERDEARAKCERLRKDAERYQLLRRGQHWSAIDGIGNTLRADDLDKAIDAALAAKGEKS